MSWTSDRVRQPVLDLPERSPTRLGPPRQSTSASPQSLTSPSVSQPVPHFTEGPPTSVGPPEGSHDPSRTSERFPRLVSDLREGPPTRP